MSELSSALPGAVFSGAAEIAEAGLRGMITLKGDLGAAKLKGAAKAAGGVDVPGPLAAAWDGDRGICWMAPDELLIHVPHGKAGEAVAGIAKALDGTHHLVADVSDARAVFTVSGPGAREVLAKLTPVDLHPDAFGPGAFRRTRLAQVAAAIVMRDAQTIEVICFRSVARYVFDILSNAAQPGTLPDHF